MKVIALVPLITLLSYGCAHSRPAFIPRDSELKREPLLFYPDAGRSRHPKAGVFFLGNDLGFFGSQQKLAEHLASHGYAVVGFDIRKFLERLPDSTLLRDSVMVHVIPDLMKRSLHELEADSLPIVLAGHSFGADLALWLEANAPVPGVVGVLALGPTQRDHPTVTIKDEVNSGEPTEPGSFAVADQIRNIPPRVRIAVLRGASDKERTSDRDFIAAGGSRMTYMVIPFAAHPLGSLIIAGPMIERALDHLIAGG